MKQFIRTALNWGFGLSAAITAFALYAMSQTGWPYDMTNPENWAHLTSEAVMLFLVASPFFALVAASVMAAHRFLVWVYTN